MLRQDLHGLFVPRATCDGSDVGARTTRPSLRAPSSEHEDSLRKMICFEKRWSAPDYCWSAGRPAAPSSPDQVQVDDRTEPAMIIQLVAPFQRAHLLERRDHRRIRALYNPLLLVDDFFIHGY